MESDNSRGKIPAEKNSFRRVIAAWHELKIVYFLHARLFIVCTLLE